MTTFPTRCGNLQVETRHVRIVVTELSLDDEHVDEI